MPTLSELVKIIKPQIEEAGKNRPTVKNLSVNDHVALITIKDQTTQIESLTEDHGHTSRLGLMRPYLNKVARDSPDLDVSVLIGTHDFIGDSHLSKQFPMLAFCKITESNPITISNIDFFSGLLENTISAVSSSDIPFVNKDNSSFFVGASTGNGDRMDYCESVSENCFHEAYISMLVDRFRPPLSEDAFPNASKYVLHLNGAIGIEDQLNYKFLVNIDGNALCYSRLYWQMASNSVPIYINRRKDLIQLHDYLIKPDVHYIHTEISEWPAKFDYLLNTAEGQDLCRSVIENGKDFCRQHFGNIQAICTGVLSYVLNSLGTNK
tara:strand:- start:8383 stop:9351 length:969 start_codon:yes stop_codon:yes gene_type:complete